MNQHLRSSISISHDTPSPLGEGWGEGLPATSPHPIPHRGIDLSRGRGEIVARGLIHAGMFAIFTTLVLMMGACGKNEKGPPQRPPTVVQTVTAVKMDAPILINAFGSTKDQASVDVVPQVSGLLLKTFIEDGALVTNGQSLFLIDERDYELRVRQAEALVAADRANLELSRLTLERNRPLHAKNMISTESFDTLKAKLDSAEAQLRMDEAAFDQARLNLARCTVVAPLAGVCSKRFVDNGNLVIANQTRLTNVRSYDPLYVEFSVSEQYLTVLRRELAAGHLPIEVAPRGDTNSYAGSLTFLDNAVNQQTGTILLRGLLPNPQLKLWSGQFVEVRLRAGSAADAVMVPESAVQFGKDGPYLFVVTEENQAALRLVKPGVRHDKQLQIIEGIAPGERVVALGQLMLFPGASVVEAPPAPRAGSSPAAVPEGK